MWLYRKTEDSLNESLKTKKKPCLPLVNEIFDKRCEKILWI